MLKKITEGIENFLDGFRPSYNLKVQLKANWNMLSGAMGYEAFMGFVVNASQYQGDFAVYRNNTMTRKPRYGVETKTVVLDLGDMGNVIAIKNSEKVHASLENGDEIAFDLKRIYTSEK